jgi:hypothetical protein
MNQLSSTRILETIILIPAVRRLTLVWIQESVLILMVIHGRQGSASILAPTKGPVPF